MTASPPAASASVCRTTAEIKRGTCYDPELQVGGHVGHRVLLQTVHPVGLVAMAMTWFLVANRNTAGPECVCVCVCMALLHHQVNVFYKQLFLQASRQIRSSVGLFNL